MDRQELTAHSQGLSMHLRSLPPHPARRTGAFATCADPTSGRPDANAGRAEPTARHADSIASAADASARLVGRRPAKAGRYVPFRIRTDFGSVRSTVNP